MPTRRTACALTIALVGSASLITGSAWGAEPRRLAVDSAGAVPLESERWLTLEGFGGDVYVRAGVDPEVRFMATRPGTRDEPLDVEVWVDGAALVLRPPADAEEPRALEVAVPADLAVRVFASGIGVIASGLRDDLIVQGEKLALDLRGLAGNVEIELSGGSLEAMNLQGDVTLRGGGFQGSLTNVRGLLEGSLTDAAVTINSAAGESELDLEGGSLLVDGMAGKLVLQARDSRVQLRALQKGASLDLTASPVALEKGKGEFDVETDAEVRFSEMVAGLHINSWGGAVTGRGNEGLLEVRTDGAAVQIEGNTGPMRVEGEGLDLRLAEIVGQLGVFTATSSVVLERCGGEITVESEFGDVLVRATNGDVSVNARDGEISILEHNGAVELWAEAPDVRVDWAALKPDKDSRIENVRGDVSLLFPSQGGARVEARSSSGGIESEIEEIRVSDDGMTAAGLLGGRQRPRVFVAAEGRVVLRADGS